MSQLRQVTKVLDKPNSVVGGVTVGYMSVKDQSVIKYYKCCKSHKMGDQEYIIICSVSPCYNIVVEILISTKRLSVIPFHVHDGCINC